MSSQLNILVISDLHCKHTSSDKTKEDVSLRSTILYSDSLRSDNPPIHPVHAILGEIDKNKELLASDILLCPGDITDKVDPQGYITGWSFLEEIKEAVSAKCLIATIGNHDVDSRRKYSAEMPFFICKSIKGNYPLSNKNLLADFWNDHFCIYESDGYIILVFNSSHTHLSAVDASKSSIKHETLKKMEEKLLAINSKKIKIALCHHHPINHSNTNYPDSDVIDKGELFLDLLVRFKFSMLIHGHKHEVKIRYYNKLLVFCAGSFSSTENIRETESENVFHKIELIGEKKGFIKTWIYGSKSGWTHKSSKKFPAVCGFGFDGEIDKLADQVANWFFTKSNGELDTYQKLVAAIPDVELLLPDEFYDLEEILTNKFHIEVSSTKNGIRNKISKVLVDE